MLTYKNYCVYLSILFFASPLMGYGLPAINLGSSNILDGGPVRPKPGIYWQQYLKYYTTHRFLNAHGKPLENIARLPFRYLVTTTQFTYQSHYVLPLHGMPGFSLSLPLVLYSKIEKNQLHIESSGSGFGNIGFGTFIQWKPVMHKERPLFIHRLEFDFAIPLGKNKLPIKQINPCHNFFYCGPNWSATLFLSHKWNLSWKLNYIWNAQNEKIDFRAGDAICVNYSLTYELIPDLFFGPVGYALTQLHNNREKGHTIPHSKERVVGLGPGVAYFHTPDIIFFSYLYGEFAARNRTEGISFIARVVMHF